MAATNYTPISLYYSTTASAAPTAGNLTNGELAINITDGVLFYKDNAGAVQTLATKAATSGTYTSITLSNGTANGVAYLNGSKILTTGTGLTFNGSALSTPVLYPTVTTGTGIQMTSTGNNNGNWTIANNYGQMTIATEGAAGSLVTGSIQGAALFGNSSNVPAQFFTNNIVRTTLDASGNLGIGTPSPAYKLHVVGGQTRLDVSSAGTSLVCLGTGSNFQVDHSTSGYATLVNSANSGAAMIFKGSSESMRISSSGNFLLNTQTVGGGLGGQAIFTAAGLSGQDTAVVRTVSGAAGNLPLGVWNDSGTGDNVMMYFYANASPSVKGGIDYNRTGNLLRFNVTSDGTLKNIIGDTSGERSIQILKTTRLRDYTWKDDEAQNVQVGPIAQELYETYKGAVSVGGNVTKTDAEGNEITEYKPWTVDKTAYAFHLVAGWQAHERIIQEQQAIITKLTDRITALEAK